MNAKEKIETYKSITADLHSWCENAMTVLKNHDILEKRTDYIKFELNNNLISIISGYSSWNEWVDDNFDIPLEVYYNDNIEEYAEKKKIELEKKKEERKNEDKKRALAEIKRLQEIYDLK